jgi:hypothetical protein
VCVQATVTRNFDAHFSVFAHLFFSPESCLQWLFPNDVDLQLRGEGADSKWVLHRVVNGKDKYLTNSAFHKLLHNVLHAGEVSAIPHSTPPTFSSPSIIILPTSSPRIRLCHACCSTAHRHLFLLTSLDLCVCVCVCVSLSLCHPRVMRILSTQTLSTMRCVGATTALASR